MHRQARQVRQESSASTTTTTTTENDAHTYIYTKEMSNIYCLPLSVHGVAAFN